MVESLQDVSADCPITPPQLEQAYRKARSGAAAGPDGIAGEAYQLCPRTATLATLGRPLKMAVFATEPAASFRAAT